MGELSGGFTPLLEVWGKGKNRTPLLVNFAYPLDWVLTLPSQDINGEDGTIQAGEYAKGDTATFYVTEDAGKIDVSNITYTEYVCNYRMEAIRFSTVSQINSLRRKLLF